MSEEALSGGSPPERGGADVSGPSLRFQLMGGLAIVLFVALFALAVAMFIAGRLGAELEGALFWLALVIVFDVGLLVWFADHRLRRLVLEPVDRMVEGAEGVAAGDESVRLEGGEASELRRLTLALNRMAERLLRNQRALAENVRSLEATNRALTEARAELVHAEKLASIGRLAAGVAHEVGNPLGAILGYLELSRRKGGGDAWVEGVETEVKRIDRIVRGLLDYARPKVGSARQVDVNEVAGRALELLEVQGRLKRLRVIRQLAEGLPAVRADPFQLEQVLVNLLLNASDAVEEAEGGGTIWIGSGRAVYRRSAGEVRTRRQDDPPGVDYSHLRRFDRDAEEFLPPPIREGSQVVEIWVADDGVGIDSEHAHRVFDPFFTTKEPGRGTGLGLAVSARLVEGMGGAIRARRREEGGSVFTVTLPLAGEAARNATGARARDGEATPPATRHGDAAAGAARGTTGSED